MKKNYVMLAILFSSAIFGQTVFNNAAGAGDGKWSTPTNWVGGALPTVFASINANVDLDIPVTLTTSIQGATATLSGVGKLTLTGATSAGIIGTGTNFIYNGAAEINTGSPLAVKYLQVNNNTLLNRQLTFGPQSVLTLTTPAIVSAPALSKVVFQGKIDGSASLQFTGTSEFGLTSDNSEFNGEMVFTANQAAVTANTTGIGAFLKVNRKVQVNANNCSLTFNGANSCKGYINNGGGNNFTLNINANQESFGIIGNGNGIFTINVAPEVTKLFFANTASFVWGTGTVAITGYQSGVIRFGTSNTALTAQKLSQITADGAAAGQALALDANGYLVLASSLSTDSFAKENQKRISYPTVVDDQVYFSKPQNNVQIFNLTGNKVFTISKSNGINSIATSQLSKGMYFIVFDGAKVEKFIKK
jgi:hypothetical protein